MFGWIIALLKKQYWSESAFASLFRMTPNIWGRSMFIISVFSVVFVLIIAKLLLIVISHKHEDSKNDRYFVENRIKRNEIVDANGELLAINLSTASLYANPRLISDPKNDAIKLHSVFPEISVQKLYAILRQNNKSFVWIKRHLTPKEQNDVNNLGIVGIEFLHDEKRLYTHGHLTSHVLGYVNLDCEGLAGVENFFDSSLREKISNSEQAGQKLELSIDSRVQNIVYHELSSAVREFNAAGAVAIVMNSKTGEILSLVSLPSFDPHNPNVASAEQLFNRATLGVYEPGSIMKSLSMAIALETNTVSLNDVYYVNNPLKVSRFSITDYKKKGPWLTVPQILMYSSNIGIGKIILEVGPHNQRDFFKKLGLLDQIKFEVPEIGKPNFPAGQWGKVSAVTMSYGHGISISPMQFIAAVNSTINGGYLLQPTLLKKKPGDYQQLSRIFSESTSDKMRKLFRLVVTHGTGKRSDIQGYFVGGKSGTANKSVNGQYSKTSRISSFVSAFPMHDPQYTILVMVDEPKPTAQYSAVTGGIVSAPVVGNIVKQIAPLLGVHPSDPMNKKILEKLWIDYDPSKSEDITDS